MFAFCIWDEKEKKILLARDKFGEKPLFYYFSDKIGFLFSSEIKYKSTLIPFPGFPE